MSDFLFELGIEEVPVSEIQSILTQLKNKLQMQLQENLVEYKHVETAATNKRFMVYFENIHDKANDKEEQIKGPAKRIAYDEHNQPTIALKKFVEFNQLQFSDLSEMETKKGVYMVVEKKVEGLPTFDILARILPVILAELAFSKTMVWNVSRINFVRPIKNILAVLDGKVIPLSFAGIHSSSFVTGHHLLSESPVEVKSFRDYCELLGKNFVILREDDRRDKILGEIREIEEEYNAKVRLTDDMLADFIYNNEYPVVFQGRFEKKYLQLPAEIISTFMIKEKKLLPVFAKQGKLLNMFVGVSNIPDENRYVKSGNERVIRATFEDAKFFWDNDREDDFIGLRELLKNVTFHKDLGTFYEKTERLAALVEFLARQTGMRETEELKQAALNCKNDLVTAMVREFPSLQGIMGGLYLQHKQVPQETWKTVYSHYEPKGFNKKVLEHKGSGLLSIADKLDNISAFLSKGIRISSSKDPYGVRRDANGIIKIILDFKLDFDLMPLIEKSASQFTKNQEEEAMELQKKIKGLFVSRMENVFKDFLKYRYDVVNSVLKSEGLFIYSANARANDVAKIVETESVEDLVALHKRLKNIVKGQPLSTVSEEFLKDEDEKILYEIFKESRPNIQKMLDNHQYLQGCSEFLTMKPVIDKFFDSVMVLAKEENLKKNRVALVQQMEQLLSRIGDFSLIVG